MGVKYYLLFLYPAFALCVLAPQLLKNKKIPFEAVFQGLCENNELCEQLCFNLHDGTFECDCQPGYVLDSNGYSCSRQNSSNKTEASILYKKEASFVAVLDEDYQGDEALQADEVFGSEYEKYAHKDDGIRAQRLLAPDDKSYNEIDDAEYDRKYEEGSFYGDEEDGEAETYAEEASEEKEDLGGEYDSERKSKILLTSPGPNLEQKVPSEVPNLEATESLTPTCQLSCDPGKCVNDKHFGIQRCQCPLDRAGHSCSVAPRIESGRFHGSSWAAFAPLREAYRDVQLTLEFRPHSPDGVLLVSGESDDLSGDFMAAVLSDGFVYFKWDCGSGAGSVRTQNPVEMNEWNRITVYRHRWDVWMQLNNGHHVQGRSEGLFSRITFREPLYVGGTYNMTSLPSRLGVNSGFDGCIKRLQVNDHIYKFNKQDSSEQKSTSSDYLAMDGWDITECTGEVCNEIECLHGGKCVTSADVKNISSLLLPSLPSPSSLSTSTTSTSLSSTFGIPMCLCPLGYAGEFCQKPLNLEVPSFNGSSLLVFPPLGSSVLSWLELEIIFRPISTEGVVLFAGHRTDGTGDFVAITLYQAHVLVTIDLGSGPLTLRSLYPIRPNLWHTVQISRTGRRTWIYVDDQLPVEGLTPGAFTMLSLAQPMFLGGLPPSDFPPAILPETSNFVGCIQKLSISNQPIHLVSGATSGANIGPCDHPCSTHPCDNGGICEPLKDSFSCRCPLGFNDPHCRSQVITQVATPSFSGKSFLKFGGPEILKRISGDKLHLWMRFRSVSPEGLLLWIGSEDPVEGIVKGIALPPLGDFLSLELKNKRMVLRYNLGSGLAYLSHNETVNLDDGEWHTLKLTRFEREAHLTIDEGSLQSVISPGDLVQLNVDSALYIGGVEPFRGFPNGQSTPGLQGCVADLVLATDYQIDLMDQADAGQNIDYC